MYLFVEKTYNILTFQQMNKYIIFGTCCVKHTKNTGIFFLRMCQNQDLQLLHQNWPEINL